MANSLSPSFAEYWSRRMQMQMKRWDIFRQIASFEEQPVLKHGDTVHRPYRSSIRPQSYTRGTAVTIRDISNTDESLVVGTAKVVPFYVDDLDELQSQYNEANGYADDAAQELSNFIDGDVLGEYVSATSKVDNAEIAAGSAGDGFTLSVANVQKVFTEAKKKLRKQHVKFREGELFAVISPEFEAVLMDYLAGKESVLGDKISAAGHIGKYMGFDLYVSDSVGWSAVLSMPTILVDTDTITINGVVFTADADGAAVGAGHFSIQTTADLCRAQLADAINNSEGYAAGVGAVDTYIEVSAADRDLLSGITATNDDTADTITVRAEGWGTVVVAEGATPADCVWTAATQIQHNLFGKKGAIDVVIQAQPKLEVKEVPDKLGKNFLPYTLYGLKTFTEGAKKLVDVRIRSDVFTASAS